MKYAIHSRTKQQPREQHVGGFADSRSTTPNSSWRCSTAARRSFRTGAILVALMFTLGSDALANEDDKGARRFTVDVAEDFSKFVPTFVNPDDGEPKRGSFFLTEGRIYPGGTIDGDGSTFDPNSPGEIGTWICRGTHLADASDIFSGAATIWVATTQNYLLSDDRHSLATEGREGAAPIVRAVIGGTGKFRGFTGEQRQELLGFNTSGGVNLRVTFILKKRDN